MSTFKKVASLPFHVERAIKWTDKCVEEILARPFEWSSRDILTTWINPGDVFKLDMGTFVWLTASVKIQGKIDTTQIEALVHFEGQTPTDVKNFDRKSALILQKITLEVTADTGESMKYSFKEKKIPGYKR